jgi:hypothetical protein
MVAKGEGKREAWPMDDDEGAVDDASNPTTDEISTKRCCRNRRPKMRD